MQASYDIAQTRKREKKSTFAGFARLPTFGLEQPSEARGMDSGCESNLRAFNFF
jgi:hypothetical protein